MRRLRRGCWLLLAIAGAHAAANAADSASRVIYRCDSGGAPTFSDRPCDAAAVVYESSTPVNGYQAPKSAPPGRVAAARPRAAARSDRKPAGRVELQEKCRRIHKSLRDIRSKMRAGYTAGEGERLRDRQTRLEQERRDIKCR